VRYVPDGSLCAASVEQIFPRDGVQRNRCELASYIMTASPIASVLFELRSQRCRCQISRDHRAERSSDMLLALHRQATRSHRPSLAMPLAAASYRASGLVRWREADSQRRRSCRERMTPPAPCKINAENPGVTLPAPLRTAPMICRRSAPFAVDARG